MSATSELLHEQITQKEDQIKEAKSRGDDTSSLQKDLARLLEQFRSINSSLSEGKVLKG